MPFSLFIRTAGLIGAVLCALCKGTEIPDRPPDLIHGPEPLTEAECADLGERIARVCNEGRPEQILVAFDGDELVERILAGVPEAERPGRGALRSLDGSLRVEFGGRFAKSGRAKFLRVQFVDGESRALVRFVSKDLGLNYYSFVCARCPGESPRWVDVFVYADGSLVSESRRWTLLPLLQRREPGFWAGLFGSENEFAQSWPEIRAAYDFLAAQDPIRAKARVDRLPDALRKTKPLLRLRLWIGRALGAADERAVLADWRSCFPEDPTPDLLGIDLALERKAFEEALGSLERLETQVGGDPYLGCVRSKVLRGAGRLDEARVAGRAALAADPREAAAYDALLQIEVDANNHEAATMLLDEFERAFPGKDAEPIVAEGSEFALLRKSPQFAEWKRRHDASRAPKAVVVPSEEECVEFGRRAERAINSGRIEEIESLFAPEQLCDRAAEGLRLPASELMDFRTGYAAAVRREGVADLRVAKSVRFLRVEQKGGDRWVWLRVLSAGDRLNYLGLACMHREDGGIGWFDLFNYSLGEATSATMRRNALPALSAHERQLRERLSRSDCVFLDNFPKIEKVHQLCRRGSWAEALRVLKELPAELRGERLVLSMMVVVASNLDEARFLDAVDEWYSQRPGDPALDLVGLDAALMRRDYLQAQRHIAGLQELFGEDPYLSYMKARVLLLDDDLDEARTSAQWAIDHESELKPAYEVLLRVEVAARNHAAVGRLLEMMESRFPEEDQYARISADRMFERFLFSADCQQWLQRRAERSSAAKR